MSACWRLSISLHSYQHSQHSLCTQGGWRKGEALAARAEASNGMHMQP